MPITAHRPAENPILTPAMVTPSHPDLEVVGVFNPAAVRVGDETILLLRVAEAPHHATREIAVPSYDVTTGRVDVRRWGLDTPGLDTSDPRLVSVEGHTWLTSISHLRVARSHDGVRFVVDPAPALASATLYEAFGVEDARITRIDDTYWINYTAVSTLGIATALASTRDFHTFTRHGVIFPPNNRDVTIFPERLGGRYVALHRPMPSGIGEPAIWIAASDDLRAWGDHRFVAGSRAGMWDDEKIGGGAVPFRVRWRGRDAWLAVYHGVTRPNRYSLGALLLDGDDPSRVLARSPEPILAPEAPYEREGFFGGVVFTCGLVVDDDLVRVYYGAADGVTALADLSLDAILSSVQET